MRPEPIDADRTSYLALSLEQIERTTECVAVVVGVRHRMTPVGRNRNWRDALMKVTKLLAPVVDVTYAVYHEGVVGSWRRGCVDNEGAAVCYNFGYDQLRVRARSRDQRESAAFSLRTKKPN